jgi:serine/threonine protein kinase
MQVVAQGKHGCIFSHPFDTLDNGREHMPKAATKLWHKPLLGKIFNTDTGFPREWELAQRIAAIDNKQEFFLYAIEKGLVDVENLREYTECTFLKAPKKAAYGQLIIPDGGVSLEAYVNNLKEPLSYVDGLKLLVPCFKGVQRLVKAKWLHQDLHAGNIVVDTKGRARIIDFGLMVCTDDAFDQKKNPYCRSPYYLHPPEYRIANAKPWSGEKSLYQRRASCNLTKSLWDVMVDAKLIELNEMYYKAYANYVKSNKKEGNTTKLERVIRKHAPRVDVYSLGVLMAWMAPAIEESERDKWYAFMSELLFADPRKRLSISVAVEKLTHITN